MVGWASVHSHTAAEQPHHIRNKRDKIHKKHITYAFRNAASNYKKQDKQKGTKLKSKTKEVNRDLCV